MSTPYTPRAVYDRLKVRSLEVTQELLVPGTTTSAEAPPGPLNRVQADLRQCQTDLRQCQTDLCTQHEAQGTQLNQLNRLRDAVEALQQDLCRCQEERAAGAHLQAQMQTGLQLAQQTSASLLTDVGTLQQDVTTLHHDVGTLQRDAFDLRQAHTSYVTTATAGQAQQRQELLDQLHTSIDAVNGYLRDQRTQTDQAMEALRTELRAELDTQVRTLRDDLAMRPPAPLAPGTAGLYMLDDAGNPQWVSMADFYQRFIKASVEADFESS